MCTWSIFLSHATSRSNNWPTSSLQRFLLLWISFSTWLLWHYYWYLLLWVLIFLCRENSEYCRVDKPFAYSRLKSARSTFWKALRALFGRFSDAFRIVCFHYVLCVFVCDCTFSDAFRTLFGRFSNAFRTLFGTCNFEVFSVEETCSMCAHFISSDASECKIREWMREKCSDPLFRANLALTF